MNSCRCSSSHSSNNDTNKAGTVTTAAATTHSRYIKSLDNWGSCCSCVTSAFFPFYLDHQHQQLTSQQQQYQLRQIHLASSSSRGSTTDKQQQKTTRGHQLLTQHRKRQHKQCHKRQHRVPQDHWLEETLRQEHTNHQWINRCSRSVFSMSLRGLHLSVAGASCPSPSDFYGAGGLGYAAFNQNGRCIVAATKRGFVVYSTEPFKQTFRRDLVAAPEDEGEEDSRGSIVLVEMLYTCNILAVVGRGSGELWRENVCILWDDRQMRSIVEMRFASPIISVIMLREALLVVLEQKVCIYLLKGLSLVDAVVTAPNPAGLCVAVTTATTGAQQDSRKTLTVACPALQKGTVQVLFYRIPSETASGPQDEAGEGDAESSLVQSISISAHENDLCCLCLSEDASLLASASVRGTLIRVFSAASGQLLKEVRRGVNPASITCLCISPCNELLAVCSSTGTLHLYRLGHGEAAAPAAAAPVAGSNGAGAGAVGAAPTTTWITSSSSATRETVSSSTSYNPSAAAAGEENSRNYSNGGSSGNNSSSRSNSGGPPGGTNVKSSWPFLSRISPYFQSEWSMTQFKFHFSENFSAVCAFGQEPQTIIAVTSDGCFYKLKYDESRGGPIVRATFLRLSVEEGV
ncbi:hypothetical protein Esti_003057 [Eimeria stiedai]